MVKRDPKRLTEEQQFLGRRCKAIDNLAREAGFDGDALAYTEFSLYPLFNMITEHCARIAEEQYKNFSGDKNEEAGCQAAANAIRYYARMIGNE